MDGMLFLGALVLLAGTVILPIAALVLALQASRQAREGRVAAERRLAKLEAEVARLRREAGEPEPVPAVAARAATSPAPAEPARAPVLPPAPPPLPPPEAAAPPPAAPAPPDLEQRIGARWASWVAAVSLVVGLALLLRMAIERGLIGPEARVALGLAAGAAMLAAGLLLRRRPQYPYLSLGLCGAGLGALYVTVYAAHARFGMVSAAAAFLLLAGVSVLGIGVSVAARQQPTAILAVLLGLLAPILVRSGRPDEVALLAYAVALNLLVVGVVRARGWPAVGRLAWIGTALVLAPVLARPSDQPGLRLALFLPLALLFLALPLLRPWLDRTAAERADLGIVVGHAVFTLGVLYRTLEPWHPAWEGPAALLLAGVYALAGAWHRERAPGDEPGARLHLGVALALAGVAVPLALDGPWVTLGWAAMGAALAWAASAGSAVAGWGAPVALGLAAARVVRFDAADPGADPFLNLRFLVHLATVAAFAVAGRVRTGTARSVAWFAGGALLLLLAWREPEGLFPAVLLSLLAIGLAAAARAARDPGLEVAAVAGAAAALVRALAVDHELARDAAGSLLNLPLLVRLLACAAAAMGGVLLDREQEPRFGPALRWAAAGALLVTLSLGWILHHEVLAEGMGRRDAQQAAWTMQAGLSVLWAVYAAAALGFGLLRNRAEVRWAGLALMGITVVKVFVVDLSEVEAVFRVLSFVVLGLVLLGVSFLYQRRRGAATGP